MKKICNNQFLQGENAWCLTFYILRFHDKWISYFETIAAFHIWFYKIFIINWKTSKTAGMDGYTSASFLTGTLLMTWTTYISAYLFRTTGEPMLYGNMTSFLIFSFIIIFFIAKDETDIPALFKSLKSVVSKIKDNSFWKATLLKSLMFWLFWAYGHFGDWVF